jgi:hypothetical protein
MNNMAKTDFVDVFMKNVSMIGGALIISQVGAGPISFDARRARRIEVIETSASTEYEDHR